MEKINAGAVDKDFKMIQKETYQKYRQHPILQEWLAKYPKSDEEILENIFSIEIMIQNEEEAKLLTEPFMCKKEYYLTLDENFEFVSKKYACLVQSDEIKKRLEGYLVKKPSQDYLEANTLNARNESLQYQKTLQQIINFTKDNKGVYLYGKMGVGKTYLIHAILNRLIHANNLKCIAIRSNELFDAFRLRINDNDEYKALMQKFLTIPILLIDDIGSELISDFNRDQVLFTILDERMQNKKLTYFTSNLSFKELEVHLGESKFGKESSDKAARIMERIKTLSVELLLNGENRRY